jgi:phosphopantothenoylcysteine decarboxylase/phosphopantothenate--cysteine ligase
MKVLLNVTGSVSAYKANELVRLLVKANHEVKIIVSKGATKFINPDLFRYLGAQEVYSPSSDFDLSEYRKISGNVLHIELARWADIFVSYPLSANTLSRFANAQADDLMSSVFLALGDKKQLHFPAMNTLMLEHPFVEENLNKLTTLNNCYIHPTDQGELACSEIGSGKLATPEEAFDLIETISFKKTKKVLITTGATLSPLDTVRYLTNPSSGLTGYYLSKEYLKKGFEVILLSTPTTTKQVELLANHPNFKNIQVMTTTDMFNVVKDLLESIDIYVSAAAISDIEFELEESKIKKDKLTDSLPIKKARDILAYVLEHKKELKVVGFAAETKQSLEIFKRKWNKKKVDLLVGNFVHNGAKGEQKGFQANENEYFFVTNGEISNQEQLTKQQLAQTISGWEL